MFDKNYLGYNTLVSYKSYSLENKAKVPETINKLLVCLQMEIILSNHKSSESRLMKHKITNNTSETQNHNSVRQSKNSEAMKIKIKITIQINKTIHLKC